MNPRTMALFVGTGLILGILCEPIMEGGRAGYRFTATGTFDRLLTGFKVVNESGGGQPIQPSLIHLLRFEIKGVALAA